MNFYIQVLRINTRKNYHDSKEILLLSKEGIFMKKPLNLTNFKINNFLGIKIQERKIF